MNQDTTHDTTSVEPDAATAAEKALRLPVEDVIVRNRYRKELGDLGPLMSSIKEIDLLQPIIVTKDKVLVSGARRLEASRQLGRKDIPVRYVPDGVSPLSLLRA